MKNSLNIFILISTVTAATIHVPADYPTIQEGIDASTNGDSVIVEQGIYSENLILEKEIVLASHAIFDDLSTNWMNNETIHGTVIRGEHNGSCLVVRYGNIQPTVMGFTFEDGNGTYMRINTGCSESKERSGGAMAIYKAYPTVNYNRFMNNGLPEENSQDVASGGAVSHFADDDVEFDEDRGNASQNNNLNRDIPGELNFQNNYFENNASGDGKNFYSFGYDGSINVSGSIFEDIDCNLNTVNDFVLRSIEDEADYIQNNISGNCIEENTYYVSAVDGNDANSGSETNPFRSIRHALSLVKHAVGGVTTLYLAPGVYSKSTNGEIFPIVLPDNVYLIGEDPETTILDADANQNNEAAVIVIKEVENVRVESLTLTGGYSEVNHGCAGGGALLITANDIDNLAWEMVPNNAEIENIIIENSHSHNGGGLSLFRVDGPTLNGVTVRNNEATMMGGGINVYASNITLSEIEIYNNSCIGTYYNGFNEVGHGGGLFLNHSSGTFDQLHIYNNTASMNGGGVWSSEGSDWVMSNSVVEDNIAPYMGGGFGFWNHNGYDDLNATLQNVTIANNVAQQGFFIGYGGGVWANNSSTVFENCSFINNVAHNNGGAVNYHGGSSSPVFKNTLFDGNSSTAYGGAIYIAEDAGGFHVEGCTFVNNSSANNGGAIQTSKSGNVINSTFFGNTTGEYGAISIGQQSVYVDVYNSILWNDNLSHEFGGYVGGFTVMHTNIQESGNPDYDGYWTGNGNIISDPLFTDAENGDFTLQAGSPCIDAGTADLNGNGTDDIFDYFGLAPDMGANEFISVVTGVQYAIVSSSVVLYWDLIDNAQYYKVERSTDSTFTENLQSNYVQTITYTDNNLEYNTEYFYRVSAFLGSYWSGHSDAISVTIEYVGLADGNQIPSEYNLYQNHPNPFNPTTTLRYDLPEDGMVNITIYDMMGRKVISLVNDHQTVGYKSIQWNGKNNLGEPVSAGVYLYMLHVGEFHQTNKMILLK
ncbi:MAG: hypothetical protein CMG57_06750 [Candidatus Marinimicrobia bacterium]|nr:hypothetical protein [Candidatus Neomarinimicrobiota bacterium]